MGTRVLVRAWLQATAGVAIVGLIVTACSAASPPASAAPTPTSTPTSTPVAVDRFAGLNYRLGLPDDWMTTADEDYDYSFETGDEMQGWLTALGMLGQQAFRAYEPSHGGEGLRLAISPGGTLNDGLSPDLIGGIVAAAPSGRRRSIGVTALRRPVPAWPTPYGLPTIPSTWSSPGRRMARTGWPMWRP